MDIGWLESFLALTEHESFTRAAEAQHLSQPAFSRRIRALELWFGEELVDRSTFPVALTAAGAKVRAGALETVAGLHTVRDEIRGRRRSPRDAVRVAATHTLAGPFFSHWWSRSGGGPCVLLASNTHDAYDTLLHGGCDLLLVYADPAMPPAMPGGDVESMTVATDRLAPFAAAGTTHTLPGTDAFPVPVVTHGQGTFFGRVTDRILTEHRVSVRPVMQSDFTAALAAMVLAGDGVGWLPELLMRQALEDERIRLLDDASLTARLEIRLYRTRGDHTPRQTDTVWRNAGLTSSTG
ncbi:MULTISPECIES: LysR family transcriptional regulator [unclassified Amycolatopsis]|uniref:LysR family transcriptional regulator n=1 Tax=unclassified Amycolatopsis TaxID=2618356 RepID=UPI00131541C0|nr:MULTISPECIES: LysR family transcriptional regulator [unclassified Amycolatopsis]